MKKQKSNFSPYILIKAGLLLLLAVLWVPYFLQTSIVSHNSFENVRDALLQVVDTEYYPQQDNQKIKRYLGLDPADYQNIEFYRTDNTLDAQELVLVQYIPGSDLTSLKNSVTERVNSQMSIFEGYAPEQYSLVEANLQDYQGNYALYYVGENTSGIRSAFERALEG